MIRMTWKIKSLILVLVLLCVPAVAIVLNSEAITHDGDVSVTSKSTNQATIYNSVASKSTSQATIHNGDVLLTSKSTTEVTIPQGDIYTISLNEDPSTGYKWTVTPSSGLKLLSDTLGSEGNRELKFRADQTGKQTIKTEYGKLGEENLKHTSEFVLNVV
jgi:inhibitor of cysteine peptidase